MTTPFLSPDPAQMHGYIDRWKTSFEELLKILQTERLEHESQLGKLRLDITRLEQALSAQAAPFEAEIESLKSDIRLLEMQAREGNAVAQNALARLAPGVGMNTAARGVTLDSVITQVLLFLDEAKKQFRESL